MDLNRGDGVCRQKGRRIPHTPLLFFKTPNRGSHLFTRRAAAAVGAAALVCRRRQSLAVASGGAVVLRGHRRRRALPLVLRPRLFKHVAFLHLRKLLTKEGARRGLVGADLEGGVGFDLRR